MLKIYWKNYNNSYYVNPPQKLPCTKLWVCSNREFRKAPTHSLKLSWLSSCGAANNTLAYTVVGVHSYEWIDISCLVIAEIKHAVLSIYSLTTTVQTKTTARGRDTHLGASIVCRHQNRSYCSTTHPTEDSPQSTDSRPIDLYWGLGDPKEFGIKI